MNRRDFLKLMAASTGGLMLAVYLDGCAPAPTPQPTAVTPATATPMPQPPAEWSPNVYLKLDSLGILTVTVARSEMGQGIRTALAMLMADELDVEWANVRIEQAPGDTKYGNQLTGGSESISNYSNAMRFAGATARQMLISAAAQTWDVEAAQCTTEAGQVIHPDGQQKLAYGSLVDAAAKLEIPKGVKTKDKAQFKIIGTNVGHWDAPKIVTGKAVFGLDVRLPGMVFAAIARCPVFRGTLDSYDDSAAKAIPGVKQIVELDDKIAVVAENSWAAIQGRNALKVTWNEGKFGALSSEELIKKGTERLMEAGKPDPMMLDVVYMTPYEAHATMEPMNCTAYVHDDVCEVWAPTQSPQDVQGQVFGVTKGKVIVHVPLIGGGFGRRLATDYAVEAAQVALAVKVPVQVVWTRDDDLQHDFYQEMSIQRFRDTTEAVSLPRGMMSGGSIVPTGAWRSVDNFQNAYGVQCFIDEMALARKRDPLDLRMEIYENNERGRNVMKLAAEKAGWDQPMPVGEGRGLAYHATFGVTHVAYVAEVAMNDSGNLRVKRVVCAIDCGQVVNPDNVAAQMESGIVFGLTAALKAQSVLKDGRMQENNFNDYPLLRMDEMPLVEVHIIESDNPSSGIGEMGVPPIAPAVANAVFAATGKRIRHIPITADDLKA